MRGVYLLVVMLGDEEEVVAVVTLGDEEEGGSCDAGRRHIVPSVRCL